MEQATWFTEWFDSPYYHILYKKHDEQDAQRSIDQFLHCLDLPAGARLLDLACGKGRHSRYLASCGFDVTGLDISPNSIEFAQQFAHDHLNFYQHDMRLPFRINYYDAVLNIFTSFGYFDRDEDHERTLLNAAKGLRPGGKLLIDYFNSTWVRNSLVAHTEQEIDGIHFRWEKRVDDKKVYKKVFFHAEGRDWYFEEKVRLFTLSDFEMMFARVGFTLSGIIGGYDGSAFDEQQSKRLILTAIVNK
jgi:SAM-dependent methyltransferase